MGLRTQEKNKERTQERIQEQRIQGAKTYAARLIIIATVLASKTERRDISIHSRTPGQRDGRSAPSAELLSEEQHVECMCYCSVVALFLPK